MRKILLTLCAALVAASSYAQWGPVNAVYLQGRMVCSTAPSNGQSLIWNTTYNCWTPTTATGGITASDDVAWTGTHTFSLGATFGASSQLKWGSSGVTSPDVGLERLLTTWLQVTNGSTGMGSMSLKNVNLLRVDDTDAGMLIFGGTVGNEFSNDTYLTRVSAGRLDVLDAVGLGALAIDGLSIGATSTLADGKLSMTSVLNDATGNETALSLAYTTNKGTSGDDTGLQIVQTDTASPGTSNLINALVGSTSYFSVNNIGTVNASRFITGASGYVMFGSGGSYIDDVGSSRARLNGTYFVRGGAEFGLGAANTIRWNSANDDPSQPYDTALARPAAGVIKVTDASTGAGTITAGGLQTGAYTAVTDGKAIINATLDDATGDEAAITINQTTNKASSGADSAIKIAFTDTASPGTSRFLSGYRGANEEAWVAPGDYPNMGVKSFASAGAASFEVGHTTDSDYLNMFANGSASSNGLLAGDVGFRYASNSHRGMVILTNEPGNYTYGDTVQHSVRLAESGGGNAVDAGVRRSAAGTVQVFNGDVNSPVAASLVTAGIDVGGTSTVADGKVSVTSTVNDATGDETAVKIAYTTNKATSGADTGLEIVQTDTASPGTSLLIDAKVATASKFSVSNTGLIKGNNLDVSSAATLPANNRVTGNDLLAMTDGSNYARIQPAAIGMVVSSVYAALEHVADGIVKITNYSTYGGLQLDANDRRYADTVSLTDGSDVAFLDIAIAAGEMMGGSISYTITATDATDFQAISGTVSFAAVRKSTTYVCDIDEHLGTDSTAVSTGTLTDTFTCAGASDKITLTINANSSLTTPTMTMRYEARLQTLNTITKK